MVVAVGLVAEEEPGLMLAVAEAGRDKDQGAKCWAFGFWDWCKPGFSRRNIPVWPITVCGFAVPVIIVSPVRSKWVGSVVVGRPRVGL